MTNPHPVGFFSDFDPKNRRSLIGTVMRLVLSPTYYWLGLYVLENGEWRPSHWLIVGEIGYFWGLTLVTRAFDHLFSPWRHTPVEWYQFAFLLPFAALVFLSPYGMQGLAAWLDWRGSTPNLPKGPPT